MSDRQHQRVQLPSGLALYRDEAKAVIDIITERDAAVAENARLLARIAAVEALPAAGASVRRKSLDETVNGVDPMSFEYGWLRAIEHVRAALAASPTPTGPEPATTVEIGGQVMTQAQFAAARQPLLASDPGETE